MASGVIGNTSRSEREDVLVRVQASQLRDTIRTVALYGDEKRAYQLAWLAARRNTWLQENGPCRTCGSWENLEVDHVIRRKDGGGMKSSDIWSRSKATREKELAKCQALCGTCHQEKSNEEQRLKEHGLGMFRAGCRCEECLVPARQYWRELRKRRRNLMSRTTNGSGLDC